MSKKKVPMSRRLGSSTTAGAAIWAPLNIDFRAYAQLSECTLSEEWSPRASGLAGPQAADVAVWARPRLRSLCKGSGFRSHGAPCPKRRSPRAGGLAALPAAGVAGWARPRRSAAPSAASACPSPPCTPSAGGRGSERCSCRCGTYSRWTVPIRRSHFRMEGPLSDGWDHCQTGGTTHYQTGGSHSRMKIPTDGMFPLSGGRDPF